MRRLLQIAAAGLMLTGCARLEAIGQEPAFSPIDSTHSAPTPAVVSLPMPDPQVQQRKWNSLWISGEKDFFRDQRARRVGDILTVLVDLNDQAEIQNRSERSRDNSESAGLDNMFGLEQAIQGMAPDFEPSDALNLASRSRSEGSGSVKRDEEISLRIAAVVVQVLPNGNLVVAGRQEIRVNYELRDLRIAGVIRPEDITNKNTIGYDKIAEARIAYGGRGQIYDVQQPRYGQQVLDILMPF